MTSPAVPALPQLGVVVIGRNEGERLARCLATVTAAAGRVVYVDSGSTDGSAARAGALGAAVVALDADRPFSAARARNAGFRRWRALQPDGAFVQFVDGDCEIEPGWLVRAVAFIEARPEVAVAFGRLRERHPERSFYNRLRDLDYDVPTGEVRGCGGNALMRASAFAAAGGFREDLICGEEPELCIRLRAQGWRVWSLDLPMATHDAAMTRFRQWWRRAMRAGYGVAQGADLHGAPPERHSMREWYRTWLWGAFLPVAAAVLAAWLGPAALTLLLAYPLQMLRVALRSRRPAAVAWPQALFQVLSSIPSALGQLRYLLHRCRGQRAQLIEYK